MSPKIQTSSKKTPTAGSAGKSAVNGSHPVASVPRCERRAHLSRKSAGHRDLFPGYLDTDKAVDNIGTSESEEEERLDQRTRGKASKRLRYYCSPTPTKLSPEMSPSPSEIDTDKVSSSASLKAASDRTAVPEEVNLTFNVPPGHSGPLVIKLDLESLLTATRERQASPISTHQLSSIRSHPHTGALSLPVTQASWASEDTETKGFLDLPLEIRNKIYFNVFVHRTETYGENIHVFDILRATTMRRSSQFLATCRAVHEEGTKILYGHIQYRLARFRQQRGKFWDLEWEAIGWKDVRRFLMSIGPINLGLIRDMVITFSDAERQRPSSDIEATRFINDPHLIACLKLLAEHAHLKQLMCIFRPKRAITFQDARFLRHLSDIRVDKLLLDQERTNSYTPLERWIHIQAQDYLENRMIRFKKLYPEKRSARI